MQILSTSLCFLAGLNDQHKQQNQVTYTNHNFNPPNTLSIMALFIIREAGQPDRRYVIREQELRCGRGDQCNLVLPHTTVSRQHFKLTRVDKDNTTIESLTDQALLINNINVEGESPLQTRDQVQCGKYTLIYFGDNLTPMDQFLDGKGLDEFPPYSRSANATKTDETFTMSIADAQRLLASNNLARNARFKRADGSMEWTPGKSGLKIGKGQEVPISGWLTGTFVAEIKWVGSAHQLESKGGWTKVLVNDTAIEHPHRLSGGDRVQVGSVQFIYTED